MLACKDNHFNLWSCLCRLMLQDSTEEQSAKRERYEYRDGSGASTGQPPPSYSAQRVSSVKFLMRSSKKTPYPPHGRSLEIPREGRGGLKSRNA